MGQQETAGVGGGFGRDEESDEENFAREEFQEEGAASLGFFPQIFIPSQRNLRSVRYRALV